MTFEYSPSPPSCTTGGTFDRTQSSTWKDLDELFGVVYGDDAEVSGEFGTDSVGFPDGPTLSNFQFGVGTNDTVGRGVLGIGPLHGEYWAQAQGDPTYPNFPQALKDQGYINKVAYSLYLNEPSAKSSSIVFGGYDTEKFSGRLVKLPITSDEWLLAPWDSTTTAGGKTVSVNASAIFDSGTPGLWVPQNVIDSITSELDVSNDAYECDQGSKVLHFNFNGVSIAVPYSNLMTPYDIQGQKLEDCLLNMTPSDGGYIALGDIFLRSAYVVYNLEDRYISLAPVKYSNSTNLVSL